MRPPQLAKQQGHELAPTRELPRVPLGLVLLARLLEIPARKQLQHLRENAAYFVHRLSLLRLNWFLSGTQSSVSGAQPLTGYGTLRFRPAVSALIWTAMNTHPLFPYSGSCVAGHHRRSWLFSSHTFRPCELVRE